MNSRFLWKERSTIRRYPPVRRGLPIVSGQTQSMRIGHGNGGFVFPKTGTPRSLLRGALLCCKSLTMTYFHTGTRTIIGAKSFHGPVRDGKEWYQLAMVIRHNLVLGSYWELPGEFIEFGISFCLIASTWHNDLDLGDQSYRVKPHEQLVLVSLTHCCASTPSLSTSWSRTTLQGGQAPGRSHLETSFPLRCFQRLSLPHLATRRCHWRDNRYTRGVSTPVLSY